MPPSADATPWRPDAVKVRSKDLEALGFAVRSSKLEAALQSSELCSDVGPPRPHNEPSILAAAAGRSATMQAGAQATTCDKTTLRVQGAQLDSVKAFTMPADLLSTGYGHSAHQSLPAAPSRTTPIENLGLSRQPQAMQINQNRNSCSFSQYEQLQLSNGGSMRPHSQQPASQHIDLQGKDGHMLAIA